MSNASNVTSNANVIPQTPAATEVEPISNGQRDQIISALATLHTVVASPGGMKPLPAFSECSEDDYELILGRASKLLGQKFRSERAETISAVRGAVEAKLAQYRSMLDSERVETAARLEKNPLAAAMGVRVPESVAVPLFDLVTAFPEGTTEAEAILYLKDLGLETAYGAGRGKAKTAGYVKIGPTEAPKV